MDKKVEKYEDQKVVFMKQLEDLRPDLFYPETWGDSEREQVAEVVRRDKVKTNMFSAIPMNCRAKRCPYADTCPLQQANIAPEGSKCPIELAMVQQFFQDYVEELGVDTTRMVEVSMVRDLVDQEIQHMRKVNLLANEHFIQDNVVGVDGNGKPILQKQMHLAVELEDRIHKRKEKLRSQLLATREARAKVGQANLDTAQVIANLLEQVQDMDQKREELLRKKLNHSLYDEYIDVHSEEDEEDEGEK